MSSKWNSAIFSSQSMFSWSRHRDQSRVVRQSLAFLLCSSLSFSPPSLPLSRLHSGQYVTPPPLPSPHTTCDTASCWFHWGLLADREWRDRCFAAAFSFTCLFILHRHHHRWVTSTAPPSLGSQCFPSINPRRAPPPLGIYSAGRPGTS